MKFLDSNGHILVNFGDGYYVVDTGSSVSFSFRGLKTISINGQSYAFYPNAPKFDDELFNFIGAEIIGFIGMDIIKRTGLSINYHTNDIEFGCVCYYHHRITFELDNYGLIKTNQVMINEPPTDAISVIDTGAKLSYVSKKYVTEANKTSEIYDDYHPEFKRMRGNIYIVDKFFAVMGSGDTHDNIKVGLSDDCPLLKKKLQALKVDNIISPKDFCSNSYVTFDFEHKWISFDKGNCN